MEKKVNFFKIPMSQYKNKIPYIVVDLFHQLQELKFEDKFDLRDPKYKNSSFFDQKKSDELIEELGRAPLYDWSPYNAYVIFDVIKQYFLRQETALIPTEFAEYFKQLLPYDIKQSCNELNSALSQLPPTHCITLAFISHFFSKCKYNNYLEYFENFATKGTCSGFAALFFKPENTKIIFPSDPETQVVTMSELALMETIEYDPEKVKSIIRRNGLRKTSVFRVVSKLEIGPNALKRPYDIPKCFENLDHDYEYCTDDEDNVPEEAVFDHDYDEVKVESVDVDYEYEIE